MIAVPLLTIISFVLAALPRHPVDGFVGMAVSLAGIGAGLGLSNIFTSTVAYPLENARLSPRPGPHRRIWRIFVREALGSLVGTLVAVSPVVLCASA